MDPGNRRVASFLCLRFSSPPLLLSVGRLFRMPPGEYVERPIKEALLLLMAESVRALRKVHACVTRQGSVGPVVA